MNEPKSKQLNKKKRNSQQATIRWKRNNLNEREGMYRSKKSHKSHVRPCIVKFEKNVFKYMKLSTERKYYCIQQPFNDTYISQINERSKRNEKANLKKQ